jgi:hypothetical protein
MTPCASLPQSYVEELRALQRQGALAVSPELQRTLGQAMERLRAHDQELAMWRLFSDEGLPIQTEA